MNKITENEIINLKKNKKEKKEDHKSKQILKWNTLDNEIIEI